LVGAGALPQAGIEVAPLAFYLAGSSLLQTSQDRSAASVKDLTARIIVRRAAGRKSFFDKMRKMF
jgi:hypothetical protein